MAATAAGGGKRKRKERGEPPRDKGVSVVLPGEEVVLPVEGNIVLGPGIRRVGGDKAVASKCGVLRTRGSGAFWIDTSSRRAVPATGDEVIGTVVGKSGDVFSIDVGSARSATLNFLRFEGATKRNRPNINIGDLVYCRVVAAGKDIEPELSCVNAQNKSGGLGKLEAKSIFPNKQPQALSPHVAFEIVAGLNGRVWVKGEAPQDTIFVYNALKNSEHMTAAVSEAFVKQLMTKMPLG